mmetsp:Transcript_11602/g.28586  ORF Transcript_11602/g.28586 Transcript_11602/m.28586 type:complete len:264 (-) Transcript_11602:29-820(-)
MGCAVSRQIMLEHEGKQVKFDVDKKATREQLFEALTKQAIEAFEIENPAQLLFDAKWTDGFKSISMETGIFLKPSKLFFDAWEKGLQKGGKITIKLAEDRDGTKLLHACKDMGTDNWERAKYIVSLKGNLDAEDPKHNLTALEIALKRGNIETCKVLVEAKACVNHINKEPQCPLLYAGSSEEAVKFLLEAKADPNVKLKKDKNDFASSPLASAVSFNYLKVAKLLLEAKADVIQSQSHPNIPLMLNAKEEMKALLSEYSATK